MYRVWIPLALSPAVERGFFFWGMILCRSALSGRPSMHALKLNAAGTVAAEPTDTHQQISHFLAVPLERLVNPRRPTRGPRGPGERRRGLIEK